MFFPQDARTVYICRTQRYRDTIWLNTMACHKLHNYNGAVRFGRVVSPRDTPLMWDSLILYLHLKKSRKENKVWLKEKYIEMLMWIYFFNVEFVIQLAYKISFHDFNSSYQDFFMRLCNHINETNSNNVILFYFRAQFRR